MLLIAGGERDPSIKCLVNRARELEVPHKALLLTDSAPPCISWDIETGSLTIDSEHLPLSSVFLRYDVFGSLGYSPEKTSFLAGAWYTTIQSWAASTQNIRSFNQRFGTRATDKPHHLILARKHGLKIPITHITNDMRWLEQLPGDQTIAKPVGGGGYTHLLQDALADFPVGTTVLPAPALVQNRLVPPEVRLFLIGDQAIAFRVNSTDLDYRQDIKATLEHFDPPAEVVHNLKSLAHEIGLDFSASDFKADPVTGELVFMEINSSPMFVRFDHDSGGIVTNAMLKWLMPDSMS